MQLIKEINLNILQFKTHKITSTFLCGEYIILKRVIARESNRKEREEKEKGESESDREGERQDSMWIAPIYIKKSIENCR